MLVAALVGATALVEVGEYADLIVIEGDPIENITDSRNVRWTVKAGQLYETGALPDAVRGAKVPAAAAEADRWKGTVRMER